MFISKRLLFLLTTVFFVLLLSGCSNNNDSTTFKISETETNLVQSNEQGTFQLEFHEGNIKHNRVFKLEINRTLAHDASVAYATLPGTALAGEDFTNASGRAVIPAGELTTFIEVEIIADTVTEPDETFTLKLSDPQGGAFSSGAAEITITQTILNEDIDPETLLSEVKAVLDDQTIPYTTMEEFEKSEYAQNQIADDKARRLEKAHNLVAIAEDPDPDWFMTEVDSPVILAEKGEQYSVNLSKIDIDQNIIGPVDNDKLRLVVRIQKSETDFEYVADADVENYARWNGLGVLDITVPDDLEQGRLMIGVRPNFDDEASNAIAERWSAAIVAEIWNTKPDTVTIDSASVLFPINDDAARGLADSSQFDRSELTNAVQEQLDQNDSLTLPIVLQDTNLQEGQLVSYVFRNSPYAGRVSSIQNRGNQQFALLTPEFFNVYEITDANDGFMIDLGVFPENMIFREGGQLLPEEEAGQSLRRHRIGGELGFGESVFFDWECSFGLSIVTFKPTFSLMPFDVGLDYTHHSPFKKTECELETAFSGYYIPAAKLFAAFGPQAAIISQFFGTGGQIKPYGKGVVSVPTTAFSIGGGYSHRDGVRQTTFTSPFDSINDIRNLETRFTTEDEEAELSLSAGVNISLNAVSNEGSLGKLLGFIDIEFDSLGLQTDGHLKLALAFNALNAKEVHESGNSSSSGFSLDVGFGAELGLTKGMVDLLEKSLVVVALEPFEYDKNLLNIGKFQTQYTFSSWDDDGQGSAKINDLRLTDDTPSIFKLLPGSPKGVLSGDVESIFNDKSENIRYDVEDCAINNDEIISPVIACSWFMCGTVEGKVKLCTPNISISAGPPLSGTVGESATQTSALRLENQGDQEVNFNLAWVPLVQPISQKVTFSLESAVLAPRSIQSVTANFTCTEPGELQGTIGVQRIGGEIENTAEIQLSCKECDSESCDDSDVNEGGDSSGDGNGNGGNNNEGNENSTISANQGGDPHFTTFDRLGYSFQGVGEFILAKSLVENGTFEVQTRYRPWGNRTDVSVAQAVAMRLDQDKVGFYRGMEPPLRINGSATELPSGESINLPSGGSINRNSGTYRFSSTDGSMVEVRNGNVDMFVGMSIPESKRGQVTGLFGNANQDSQDDIMTRDGTLLGTQPSFDELYPAYADSWRISQGESLFDYAAGETTETFTDRDFPSMQTTTSTLPENIRASAEQTCRDAGITNTVTLDNCILDVALTGETGFSNIPTDVVTPNVALDVAPPALLPEFGDSGFGQFTGSVINGLNEEPLANGAVSLTVDGNPLSGNHESVVEDGRYETSVIPVGSGYELELDSDGFIPEKIFGLEAQNIQKSEIGTVALIPLSHAGLGIVSGTIRSALNNSEVAGLNVYLRRHVNSRTGSAIATVATNQNGSFQFENLDAGNYTLEVQGEGYITTYLNAVNLGGQTNQVNGVVSPELGASQFLIVLTWGDNPADLDAHLTGPDGDDGRFHVYFSALGNPNLALTPHVHLDRDDTDGTGPETITVDRLLSGGRYRFSVHDYSNQSSTSSQDLGGSGAKVEVYGSGNQLLGTFNVPNQSGTLWTVFEINELGVIVPINQLIYESSNNNPLLRRSSNGPIEPPMITDYWQVLFQKPKKD